MTEEQFVAALEAISDRIGMCVEDLRQAATDIRECYPELTLDQVCTVLGHICAQSKVAA
jgi:hypothetical protein